MEFIGRLHPVLVHLPIGILLLAVVFEWLPFRKPYKSLRRSIRRILWIGFIVALASAITGYTLSQTGDYDLQAVKLHQFSGIALTLISLIYAWVRGQKQLRAIYKFLSLLLFALIVITGHLGGSLTHGENFLFVESQSSVLELDKINLQQARLYADLVQPVLEARCYNCHGPSKQKGKLRLDNPDQILKGGKNGPVVIAGSAAESEFINRILLPVEDEDHMPPKEKKQLTQNEVMILKLWVDSGADFEKSVVESNQLGTLQKILASNKPEPVTEIPEGNPDAANSTVVNELKKLDAVVLPVAHGSNYLSVNLVNVVAVDSAIDLLISLKQQMVWLKAGDLPIQDSHLSKLAQLNQITKLNLERSAVTDAGLAQLNSLTHLQYLNLNQTTISAAGIKQLNALKNLRALFVFGTRVTADDATTVQNLFPNTKIEIGNYIVPTLETDTTLVK